MTIWLESPYAAAAVVPDRGLDIVHFGRTRRPVDNVLAALDWDTPLPASHGVGYGDRTQDWLSEYRGGWQLLAPSAGAPSVVDGVDHPFHGEVSRARWTVEASTPESVTARVATHGPISVRRTIALDLKQARITATTVLSNHTLVAGHAILVEHIAFQGSEESRVTAPVRSIWQHDPNSPESASAPDPISWGDSELARPRPLGGHRLVSLTGNSEGWMSLQHSPGQIVRVEWDPEQLPHVWHWQERGSSGFPWYGRADISAIEPASASFSDGLASAIERGEAWEVAPGQAIHTSVVVRIEEMGQ